MHDVRIYSNVERVEASDMNESRDRKRTLEVQTHSQLYDGFQDPAVWSKYAYLKSMQDLGGTVDGSNLSFCLLYLMLFDQHIQSRRKDRS